MQLAEYDGEKAERMSHWRYVDLVRLSCQLSARNIASNMNSQPKKP